GPGERLCSYLMNATSIDALAITLADLANGCRGSWAVRSLIKPALTEHTMSICSGLPTRHRHNPMTSARRSSRRLRSYRIGFPIRREGILYPVNVFLHVEQTVDGNY